MGEMIKLLPPEMMASLMSQMEPKMMMDLMKDLPPSVIETLIDSMPTGTVIIIYKFISFCYGKNPLTHHFI